MNGEEKLLITRNDNQLTLQDAERRSRQRLCLALVLVGCSCILVGAMGVWKMHNSNNNKAPHDYTETAARAIQSITYNNEIPNHCETTLLLFRHCEKEGHVQDSTGNQHCSHVGYQRAAFLATLFGPHEQWPLPSYLFALQPERGHYLNYREYETLLPLSEKAAIPTNLVPHPQLAEQYLDLLASGALCNRQLTVVSWKHSYIVELAALLGCGPNNGCPSFYDKHEFDQVWRLHYKYHHSVVSSSSVEDDTSRETNNSTRFLKKKRCQNDPPWTVDGTVMHMNFDPSVFRFQHGDKVDTWSGGWEPEH